MEKDLSYKLVEDCALYKNAVKRKRAGCEVDWPRQAGSRSARDIFRHNIKC